jgi:hypothetical protein
MNQRSRRRGLLYPIEPDPGLIGAQPAVHNFFNTRLCSRVFAFWDYDPLPDLSALGDLGSSWVELGQHRGRAGGNRKIARIAMIAKIAGIEKQRLTADSRE